MGKRKTKDDAEKTKPNEGLRGINVTEVIIDEFKDIPEEVLEEVSKMFLGYHPVTNEEMFA